MKRSHFRFLILTCICLFTKNTSLLAQTDAHYWTHQFGAKGLLLNGAVIASTEDETAVFYNPGAMTSDDDFSLSLSFLTPSYSVLTTKNFLGDGNTIKDKNLGFAPGLGSVGFNLGNRDKVRVAITSFTRYKSNIRFRNRIVNGIRENDLELFISNLEFERKLSERWFGAGISYKLTDYVSVGISQFMTFHSESTNLSIQKELVNKTTPNIINLGWRSRLKYSFSAKGGMLTKVGFLASFNDIKLGITLTSPTYKPFLNKASYEYDDLKTFGSDSTQLISNLSSTELLDYKTPFSIGFGMDFPFRKTHLSFSVEYFKGIDKYFVIDGSDDPFNGFTSNGERIPVLVEAGNKRVLNVAVGGQTKLTKKVSLIWGFRTDFNQREIDQNSSSAQFLSTTPNVFHFSIGNSLDILDSKFSYGLDYGFGGKKDDTQLVDFSNVNSSNLFEFAGDGSVISEFQSISFILAYDFRFRKKRKKKKE